MSVRQINIWVIVRQIYIYMGDCSSDVNYAGVIALHMITKCARLFVAYCVFLHCSDNGIVTIIAMHVVNMCGRVIEVKDIYCFYGASAH